MIPSILNSVKKMLGITSDFHEFDADILTHINAVLAILTQMGVGPEEGFIVYGEDEEWDDLGLSGSSYSYVKTYVFLKVKKLFDPSGSSSAMSSYDEMIKEYETRMYLEYGQGK